MKSLINKLKFYSEEFPTNDLKIAISSSANYIGTTKKFVTESLIKNGFSKINIYIIIGGSSADSIEIEDGFNVVKMKCNAFDLNAYFGIIDFNLEGSYWLIIMIQCLSVEISDILFHI